MDNTTLLVICIFPFAFGLIWVFVNFILSRMGWYGLSKHFLFDKPFEGINEGIISANINGVNYNNILILKHNREGFYLKTILLFRLFHPPLFIPWAAIADSRDATFLFFRYKELAIGNPRIARVRLSRKTFDRMEGGNRIDK